MGGGGEQKEERKGRWNAQYQLNRIKLCSAQDGNYWNGWLVLVFPSIRSFFYSNVGGETGGWESLRYTTRRFAWPRN